MLTVIAYDIADDRRRQRVSSFLEDHGERVNFSVFECDLDRREFVQVQTQLRRLINRREDRVVFYRLCEECRGRRTTLGQLPEEPSGPPGVVFV
jgi:CRISPR-associated protein Cas2